MSADARWSESHLLTHHLSHTVDFSKATTNAKSAEALFKAECKKQIGNEELVYSVYYALHTDLGPATAEVLCKDAGTDYTKKVSSALVLS